MVPKYWTIQQVAERLAMPAPTVRLWVKEGRIKAFRLQSGHRRIGHDELDRLCRALGRPNLPMLATLDATQSYRLEEASEYLGISARYLRNSGLSLSQGGTVTGGDIASWETMLYRTDETPEHDQEGDEEMPHFGPHHRNFEGGPEGFFMHRGPWFGPFANGWDDDRPHSVLWLRSMKRHLEAQKADIEDRLQWVEEELKKAEPDD